CAFGDEVSDTVALDRIPDARHVTDRANYYSVGAEISDVFGGTNSINDVVDGIAEHFDRERTAGAWSAARVNQDVSSNNATISNNQNSPFGVAFQSIVLNQMTGAVIWNCCATTGDRNSSHKATNRAVTNSDV